MISVMLTASNEISNSLPTQTKQIFKAAGSTIVIKPKLV